MMTTTTTPTATSTVVTSHDSAIQSYYTSFNGKIIHNLILGGRIHWGYWEKDTYWPFPISRAQERMEDKLAGNLNLPSGSYVLDAGCGNGLVALHVAKKFGFRIQGIDIVSDHVENMTRNITRSKLPKGQVKASLMDVHNLDSLQSESFDGIYTIESFVHVKEPERVLKEFFRLLRPGGHFAQMEYAEEEKKLSPEMMLVNQYIAMPALPSNPRVYKEMLEEAGFINVVVRDYSEKIRPLSRLFFTMAYIPYLLITFFGLERYFIHIIGAVNSYREYGHWHYLAISATKPGGIVESPKSV